jgi:hypothetical protein
MGRWKTVSPMVLPAKFKSIKLANYIKYLKVFMKLWIAILLVLPGILFFSCKEKVKDRSLQLSPVYNREPADDSLYKNATWQFFYNKNGQLCEKKHVMAGPADSACNCELAGFYDSAISIKTGDAITKKLLRDFIDVPTFTELDATQYSKDKNHVYYFDLDASGGTRFVVTGADAATFKRLYEYRWGVDTNHVFFKASMLEGLNVKKLQLLYPPDTSNQFLFYVKDDHNVFFQDEKIADADALSFKLVLNQAWDAEDKNFRYQNGKLQ